MHRIELAKIAYKSEFFLHSVRHNVIEIQKLQKIDRKPKEDKKRKRRRKMKKMKNEKKSKFLKKTEIFEKKNRKF